MALLVHGFHRLYNRLTASRRAEHITIGEIYKNEIKTIGLKRFDDPDCNLWDTHLLLETTGGHVGLRDKLMLLSCEGFLLSSIEEIRHVRIIFPLDTVYTALRDKPNFIV
jgi:hypothetical protein